jgi:hypothetical protein
LLPSLAQFQCSLAGLRQREFMAIKTLHLTNAFHTHSGGISAFYRDMLHMANQQRWDCAALAYFSLYDAMHAEFRAADSLACFPPTHGLRPPPIMPMQ